MMWMHVTLYLEAIYRLDQDNTEMASRRRVQTAFNLYPAPTLRHFPVEEMPGEEERRQMTHRFLPTREEQDVVYVLFFRTCSSSWWTVRSFGSGSFFTLRPIAQACPIIISQWQAVGLGLGVKELLLSSWKR
jgi:hypothetical protein